MYIHISQTLITWPNLKPKWHSLKVVEKPGLLICTNFVVPVCCYFIVLSNKI